MDANGCHRSYSHSATDRSAGAEEPAADLGFTRDRTLKVSVSRDEGGASSLGSIAAMGERRCR